MSDPTLVIGAVGFAVAASVYAGVCVARDFCTDRAFRRSLQSEDQSPSDRCLGDWPVMPSDFKVSHSGTYSAEGQHDHV